MDNRHQEIAGSVGIKEANDRSDFFCRVRIHRFVRLREASKLDTQTVSELVHCKPWQEESVVYVPTVVNIDSSAAQALAMNEQASARTKYINLKYHYVKDALKKGLVVLHDVISAENRQTC